MRILNRAAIVVFPAPELVHWINRVDPIGEPVSLQEAEREPSIYLIAEYVDNQEFSEILQNEFDSIFENELRGWYTDESLWPQDRTLDLFRSWFRIEPTSLVHDVATGPYVVEDA